MFCLAKAHTRNCKKSSYFLARVEHYLPIKDFEDAITMELKSLYRRMELRD